jgi:hypothetical protein
VAERVLTIRELNRALLARQLLLERSALPLTRALERVAGLQTQYAPTGYISLWTRLRDFPREALTRALEGRRAVQGTLMRTTIHTVSKRDFALFAAGTRQGRRDWWLRTHGGEMDARSIAAAAARVREHLATGPRSASQLKAFLQDHGFDPVAWSGVGLWVDLVRVPPSGTWERRRADLYGVAEQWLGPSVSAPSEAEGLKHLVRRYLGGFGPASPNDVASWAGLPVGTIRPLMDGLRLRRFHDERGAELFDVPGAPLPDGDTPAPVRLLPTWEAALLVHARRSQILPEPYRPLVFNTRTPQSVSTFLVDGAVAGTWRYEGGRVRLEPFAPLARASRRALEDEAEGLAEFHAG